MRKNDCVWIGVGIHIPKDTPLYEECIQINEFLYKEYGEIWLFSETNAPHLNLYDLSVPKRNINKILPGVKESLKDKKKFIVRVESINHFPFGLFFLKFHKSSKLFNLHKNLVEIISPLKETCLCGDFLQPHRIYSPRQKEILELHGNPYVLEEFNPHITLGQVKNNSPNLDTIKHKLDFYRETDSFEVKIVDIVMEIQNGESIGGFNTKVELASFNLV